MHQQEIQTKRLLVVEDDEMFRILLRDAFWIHGPNDVVFEVVSKRSIEEASEYLEHAETPPDMVFVGLWLLTAHKNGTTTRDTAPTLEFIKHLKGSEKYKKVVIIVYSRFSEAEFKEKAREAGADHYLVKGELTPREIVDFVEGL